MIVLRRVFPGDRRSDGEHVEKVFVAGSHDIDKTVRGYKPVGGQVIDVVEDEILELEAEN